MHKPSLQLLVIVTLLTFSVSGNAQQQTNPPQGNPPRQQEGQPRTAAPNNTNRETGDQRQGLANQMTPQSFIQEVAESNQKEIEISRMATTRAESNAVKNYARQLITDHTKALDSLRAYASKHNMTVPALSRSDTVSNARAGDTSPANRGTTPRPGQDDPAANRSTAPTGQAGATPRPGQGDSPARTADGRTSPEMDQLNAKSGKDFDKAYIDMMVEDHEKAVTLFEQQNRAKTGDAELQKLVSQQLPTLRQHLNKAKDLQKTVSAPAKAEPRGK